MIEKFKILGITFSDADHYKKNIKDRFDEFQKSNLNNDGAVFKFLEEQRQFFENQIQEFLLAVERTAWLPPLHEAIPLLYVAKLNLEALSIKVNNIIQLLQQDKRLTLIVSNEMINQEIAQGNRNYDPSAFKKEEVELQQYYDFQNRILLPLLYSLLPVFRMALEEFKSVYGIVLTGLESERLKGQETVSHMANNLANIKSEEDLFVFININSAGELVDKLAYKKLDETSFTPEQLALIFYYLRKCGIITLENDSALSRHISLISGKSNNTIYQALKSIIPNRKKLKASVLTEHIKHEPNHNAEEIKRTLDKIKILIDDDVQSFHAVYS